MQDRRKGRQAPADALHVGEDLLIPALPALGAVLGAAHLDPLVTDRALALSDAGDRQHRVGLGQVGKVGLNRGRHRVDLDLPGAPAERVVVRRRDAPAEDVDEESAVERRGEDAQPDPRKAGEPRHDVGGGDRERRQLLAGVGIVDGQRLRRREPASLD